MTKNILTLFLLLIISPAPALAQSISVEGHIIDGKTGRPVIGANIFLVNEAGFREGTSSDESGHFIFLTLTKYSSLAPEVIATATNPLTKGGLNFIPYLMLKLTWLVLISPFNSYYPNYEIKKVF